MLKPLVALPSLSSLARRRGAQRLLVLFALVVAFSSLGVSLPGMSSVGNAEPVRSRLNASAPSPAPSTSSQLITVNTPTPGSAAGTLSAWQRDSTGAWNRVLGPIPALVGAGGIGQASEGSTRTPVGTFSLTESFGRQANPGTLMPYFRTDTQDWWNGDSSSPAYNTHVRQVKNPGGASENLYRAGPVYDYAVNIGYNLQRTPGAGSAFFLHVTDGAPTAGCVAIDRNSILTLLRWLDPAQNPHISIGVGPEWSPDPPESRQNPLGDLNSAATGPNPATVTLRGWAFDPNSADPVVLHIYDNRPDGSVSGGQYLANVSRPDVAGAYGIGNDHGFVVSLNLSGAGTHRICVYAINVGRGTTNPEIACAQVTVPAPMGSLDGVGNSSPGTISLGGWAADPSAAGWPVAVHVYVTGPLGVAWAATSTATPRPDVNAVYGWAGSNQGFALSAPTMGVGTNRVCAFAIDAGPPQVNPALGCKNISVRNAFGSVDGVSATASGIQVSGWALNPNNASEQVQIHIYDSGPTGLFKYTDSVANTSRPDVSAVYTGISSDHGYNSSVPATGSGPHRVCVYAITTGGGQGNTELGCATVTVP